MGKLVHTGEQDHLFLNGMDDWIGGVHLLGKKEFGAETLQLQGF